MSINNSYGIQVIESDGITKRHAFSFFINRREDLKIEVIDTNNSITNLIYGVDYTVENKFDYYDGGYFNLNRAEPVGYSIVVYRETPINQEFNFLSLQAISPTNLTSIFDKLTVISQEINAQLGRTAKFDFEGISLIDQSKPLNESNIKNINTEINENRIVALTLKYNSISRKWELYTSKTDPDDKKEQGTEDKLGVYRIATQGEVGNGSNDSKVITPLKLKSELDRRKADNINEEDLYKYVNAKQVKDYVGEKVVIANQEEITNGNNDSKFVTPLKLKNELDTRQASDMEVGTGSNLKKYINPRQLNDYMAEKIVIASQNDITIGSNDSKFITPLKLKGEIDRRKADNINEEDLYKYVNAKQVKDYVGEKVVIASQEEITNGTNDSKFITPLKLKSEIDVRQSTDTEIESGEDVKKYINPKQFNNTILKYSSTRTYLKGDMCYQLDMATSKPYIYYSLTDNNLNNPLTDINHWKSFDINGENIMQIATQDEVTLGINDEKVISPLKLKNEIDSRQATDTQLNGNSNLKVYVNPYQLNNQLNNYLDNRIASSTELNNASDVKKYVNPKQLKSYISDKLIELKENFNVTYNTATIEFINLDLSYEHIFTFDSLLSTNSNCNVYCGLGYDGGYTSTNKHTFISSIYKTNYEWVYAGSYSNVNDFRLTSSDNSGCVLHSNIYGFGEIHIKPTNNNVVYVILEFGTFEIPSILTRCENIGIFSGTERATKFRLFCSNGDKFAGGKVKHYIIK